MPGAWCSGFNAIGLVAPAARASPASSSSTTFRNQSPPPWRHAAAASGRWSSPIRNSDRACRLATSSSHHNDHHHRRRQRHLQRCDHGAAISRIRRRPCHSSSPSSLSTGSWRGSAGRSSTSRSVSRGSSPGGDADAFEEDSGEEGGGLATTRETVPGARRKSRKKDKKGLDDNKKKSALGKAGDAIKATFNAFMAASTVVSIALAAEAFWQLHGTPLTLSNAVPTLTKLLPLTGIGVFGAAQLVGVVARVVRVIVTLPIMLSGAWVILQNAPKVGRFGCLEVVVCLSMWRRVLGCGTAACTPLFPKMFTVPS